MPHASCSPGDPEKMQAIIFQERKTSESGASFLSQVLSLTVDEAGKPSRSHSETFRTSERAPKAVTDSDRDVRRHFRKEKTEAVF